MISREKSGGRQVLTKGSWPVQGTIRGLPRLWAGARCNPRYLLLHLHIAQTAGTIVMIAEAGSILVRLCYRASRDAGLSGA